MVTVSRSRTVRCAFAALLAALTVTLFGAAEADANGKRKPMGKDGKVHACYKVKGKDRGTVRLVRHPRACRKLRGWHRLSWGVQGLAGAPGKSGFGVNGLPGLPGPQGVPGPAGEQGPAGAQGSAGEFEQTLIETVETQTVEIEELTSQVTSLTGQVTGLGGDLAGVATDLVDLEGTVEGACTQLAAVTGTVDDLIGGVTGISLIGELVTLVIPELPALLGDYECV